MISFIFLVCFTRNTSAMKHPGQRTKTELRHKSVFNRALGLLKGSGESKERDFHTFTLQFGMPLT